MFNLELSLSYESFYQTRYCNLFNSLPNLFVLVQIYYGGAVYYKSLSDFARTRKEWHKMILTMHA